MQLLNSSSIEFSYIGVWETTYVIECGQVSILIQYEDYVECSLIDDDGGIIYIAQHIYDAWRWTGEDPYKKVQSVDFVISQCSCMFLLYLNLCWSFSCVGFCNFFLLAAYVIREYILRYINEILFTYMSISVWWQWAHDLCMYEYTASAYMW